MRSFSALEPISKSVRRSRQWAGWALGLVLMAGPALAQSAPIAAEADPCKPGYTGEAKCDEAAKAGQPAGPTLSSIKALDTFIKDKTKIEGLFTIYRDDATGKHFMEVREDQLGKDFIYFSFVHNGSANLESRQSGTLRDNVVFQFRRTMNRIDILLEDTEFDMTTQGPMARLQGRNVVRPLIGVEPIVARAADQQTHLIDVSKVFSRNAFVRLGVGAGAATANGEESTITAVRNYPGNLEIIGEHVLRSATATSPRTASEIIRLQHTILPMPKAGFEPRLADPRVGYFTSRKTNLAAIEGLPVADVIQRWRLEKTDPAASVSPALNPIVFWIENTTPLEYRDIIVQAILGWNRAFLQAGISGAIEAKIQPDDANWDAGDARYHVLQWSASPTPRYLGYGPSFTNPRTGEILGADIVLEHASLARSIRTDRLFHADLSAHDVGVPAPHDESAREHGHEQSLGDEHCLLGTELALNMAYANVAAQIGGGSRFATKTALRDAIIRQGLKYLVIHEVGHTLGLTHNMMGSAGVPLRSLHGPGSETVQPSASVMDYPAINIAPAGKLQGMFFPDQVGPYDIWAIQFGYDSRLADGVQRKAHLARSVEPSLRLGNDTDVVATPDQGIDPRVNMFDLSNDPIGFGRQQIELVWQTMPVIIDRLVGEGETTEESVGAFRLLLSMIERSSISAARHIGGIHVERTVGGQSGTQAFSHTPISLRDQKRAMDLLTQHVFAPSAFTFPPALLANLQRYRRGFDLGLGLTRQDVTVHALVRQVQATTLTTLLHDRTLRRISDTALYGNQYSVHAMVRDLTNAAFAADNGGEVNSFRRNLQVEFVRQVSAQWRSGRLDAQSEAALLSSLEAVKSMMQASLSVGTAPNQAHKRYIVRMVNDALDPRVRAGP